MSREKTVFISGKELSRRIDTRDDLPLLDDKIGYCFCFTLNQQWNEIPIIIQLMKRKQPDKSTRSSNRINSTTVTLQTLKTATAIAAVFTTATAAAVERQEQEQEDIQTDCQTQTGHLKKFPEDS